MEQRSAAAYHRAAAARARRLLSEATTCWLKEHLAAAIARHDQLVEEIERVSDTGYHPALRPYIWISPVMRLVANSPVAVSAVVVSVSG